MTDEMAEMNYARRDPQFFDEEAALKADLLKAWNELKEKLEEADTIINRIVDMDKTADAFVTSTFISGALDRAERNAE